MLVICSLDRQGLRPADDDDEIRTGTLAATILSLAIENSNPDDYRKKSLQFGVFA